MALTITATISVTEEGYTPLEARIIAAMQAHPAGGSAAPAAAPAAPVEEKPKAAPKRAPKAAPAPVEEDTTPAVLDTTLDEPAAPAEEDLLGTTEAKAYTLDEAVALATTLVGNGEAAKVKAALEQAGAKRVGELKDNVAGLITFMTALGA